MNTISYDPIADIGLGFSNLIQSADIAEGASVLNWGCGSGDPTFVIRRCIGDSGRAIGIDYSVHNISLARQNCGNFGYSNVTFFPYQSVVKKSDNAEETACQQTVFDDATFDIAVCNNLLNLFPIREKIFREIYRLLKPGGNFLITDLFPNQAVTAEQTKKITQKYLRQIYQDYDEVIANTTINLLENIYSSSMMTVGTYCVLLRDMGFGTVHLKTKTPIDANSGELLLYMEHNDLQEFVKSKCVFSKFDLQFTKTK